MEDNVQVRCSRCKHVFRERAKRLQDGFSRQCPGCEVVLFFNEVTHDTNIKRAMRDARAVRKQMRLAEEERMTSPRRSAGPSRRHSGREAPPSEE